MGLVTGCALALTPGLAAAATGSGICRGSCVASGGGMSYRVISYYHLTASDGQLLTAVGYTITNGSSRSHVFAPLPGGFTAVATDGSYIQVEDYIGGAAPNCYSPAAITPGATHPDPDSYTIKPRQARKMKLMCFVVPAGEKLAKVQFADNDATSNAVVMLGRPSPPADWSLPNLCKLPPRVTRPLDLNGHVNNPIENPGTPMALLTCAYYRGNPHVPLGAAYDLQIWVANEESLVRPVGGRTRIKGWPGAELFSQGPPLAGVPADLFFKRRFHNHDVWVLVWFFPSSCNIRPAWFAAARAVYLLFGPGPPVSVPSKSINLCRAPY